MSTTWQESFAGLQVFIKSSPGIAIGKVVISIPDDVRPEFYRLFDDVRMTFVEEKFPALLREAEILSKNYTQAEQEVKALLKLDNIYTLGFLDKFLHGTRQELTRELFNPLFELLRGTIDSGTFERQGIKDIEAIYERSHRLGYAKWLALTLVKELESDKIFAVAPPECKLDGHGAPICCEDDVSYPQESKYLTFEHGPDHYPPFITPHFIVHSAKLKRYVSIRTELIAPAEYIALNSSEKREWYNFASLKRDYNLALTNPGLLIYLGDQLEDLALIADKDRMCRPDMIVEYREPWDWEDKDITANTKLYDVLNPKLGRYIVSREPVAEPVSQEKAGKPVEEKLLDGQGSQSAEKAVYNLTVNFDPSKLAPIMDKLVNADSLTLEKTANA